LSFEEGLLASKARQRLGLASPRLVPDEVIDREPPGIGTVPNTPNAGWVEQATRGPSLRPIEHAMFEAAIQMDLITPEQADALVEKGKTIGEWLVEQEKGEAGKAKKVKQRMLDVFGVLTLLLFNLAVLVGLGWIVLRVLKAL
jgi:hypothetical protein